MSSDPYLQVREVGAHAAMTAASEPNEAEALLVLLPTGAEAVRVVL